MITAIITITVLLGIYYCSWVTFNLVGWSYYKFMKKDNYPKSYHKLSVIIACRNEEDNIEKCLESLLSQNYPKELYEVIVVDDGSTDKTTQIIKKYEFVNLQTNKGEGKKQAIATGIEVSNGDIIVATDADCWAGDDWLNLLNKEFANPDTHLVCGPVCYDGEKGFFQKWQTFELASIIGMSGGGILGGFPNTSNGANIAYRKKTFNNVGGFGGNEQVVSGDDDFLMHKVHTGYKKGVTFIKEKAAIVYTKPQPNFNSFINQRIRWASKTGIYKRKMLTTTLAIAYLFYFSFVVNAILGFINPVFWELLMWQTVAKLYTEAVFFAIVLPFFNKQKLFWMLPQAEILHIIYVIYIGIRGNFGGYTWKGRRIVSK